MMTPAEGSRASSASVFFRVWRSFDNFSFLESFRSPVFKFHAIVYPVFDVLLRALSSFSYILGVDTLTLSIPSPCYHFFRRRFDNWFAARYFWLPIVLNASFAAILPRVVKYHKPSPQRLAVLHLLILRDLKSSNAHTIRGHTFGDTSLVLFIIWSLSFVVWVISQFLQFWRPTFLYVILCKTRYDCACIFFLKGFLFTSACLWPFCHYTSPLALSFSKLILFSSDPNSVFRCCDST